MHSLIEPKGWHSRGYLPHYDAWNVIQMITCRPADALPKDITARLEDEKNNVDGDTKYRKRIEKFVDSGHGSCIFKNPEIAQIVQKSFFHFNERRYRLHALVVMPNHVHILVEILPPSTTSFVIQGWKSFSSHEIKKKFAVRQKIWQEDYWDRYIRGDEHYQGAVLYIINNPLKAGLVRNAREWPWLYVKDNSYLADEDVRAPF